VLRVEALGAAVVLGLVAGAAAAAGVLAGLLALLVGAAVLVVVGAAGAEEWCVWLLVAGEEEDEGEACEVEGEVDGVAADAEGLVAGVVGVEDGVAVGEEAWSDFSWSCFSVAWEVATAPWALAIARVRPETPGAVGPEVEPGWVPAAAAGLEALATGAGALGELLPEWPWSSTSQPAASRATAKRPIW
jgi:hypothetical protein